MSLGSAQVSNEFTQLTFTVFHSDSQEEYWLLGLRSLAQVCLRTHLVHFTTSWTVCGEDPRAIGRPVQAVRIRQSFC